MSFLTFAGPADFQKVMNNIREAVLKDLIISDEVKDVIRDDASLRVFVVTPTLSKLSDKGFRELMAIASTLDDEKLMDFNALYVDEIIKSRSEGRMIDISFIQDAERLTQLTIEVMRGAPHVCTTLTAALATNNIDTISKTIDTLDFTTLCSDPTECCTMTEDDFDDWSSALADTLMVKMFVLMGFSEEASKRLADTVRDSGVVL